MRALFVWPLSVGLRQIAHTRTIRDPSSPVSREALYWHTCRTWTAGSRSCQSRAMRKTVDPGPDPEQHLQLGSDFVGKSRRASGCRSVSGGGGGAVVSANYRSSCSIFLPGDSGPRILNKVGAGCSGGSAFRMKRRIAAIGFMVPHDVSSA
jgi:hypothetical protein